MNTVAQPVITADGASIHVEAWGEGQPVVFTHGWSVGHEMWEYQMSALAARGRRCIGIDRRGCGRSTSGRAPIDLELIADDLAAVLDNLDLSDLTLVAHSVAAAEAVRMLARHRHAADRVARLVLVAPITPALVQSDDNPEGLPTRVFDEIVAGLCNDKPGYLAAAAPGFFGGPGAVSDELMAWGVRLAERASLRTSVALVRTYDVDLRAELAAVTIPTLIVHSDADQSAPLDLCGRRTAAGIAGSTLEIYADGPHGIPLAAEFKDRLTEDIAAFIGAAT
jgi:pimeloyl-ACP methyl ester carboxylesterase